MSLKSTSATELGIEYSIVIPAKNEAHSLNTLIPQIMKKMSGFNEPFEILVVNDCSTDETETVLRNLQSKYPKLRYITVKPQYIFPVGLAIRLGIKHSLGKFIISMDGDGSHLPGELQGFIEQKKRGKLAVIGGRYFQKQTPFQPISRYFISKLFNFMTRTVVRTKISDLTTGYRLFLRDIGLTLTSQDFEIHVELNLKISHLPTKAVAEIPIHYIKRKFGKSKLKYLKVLPRYLFRVIIDLVR